MQYSSISRIGSMTNHILPIQGYFVTSNELIFVASESFQWLLSLATINSRGGGEGILWHSSQINIIKSDHQGNGLPSEWTGRT